MSAITQNTAKWLCLALSVLLLVACSAKPQPRADRPDEQLRAHLPVETKAQAKSARLIALDVAREMVGVRYRYGGSDPSGFDCSGLVHYSFQKAGVSLPRTSQDIFRSARLVAPHERQPGDLVFFTISSNKVSHVGIYVDRNRFIHAPSSGKGVGYASLENPYWRKRLVAVGRI